MELGKKIKILREIKGISTKEMASELSMSAEGYLKIERNEVDINTEKIEKISEKLGIKPYELLLEDKIVFNNNHTVNGGAFNTVNFPIEMIQLYQDKIRLLEERIKYLEEKVKS